MQKPFLLIAGDNSHPRAGTGDWIARFDTAEQAEACVIPLKVGEEPTGNIRIQGEQDAFDWYKIVDLRTFML